MITVLHKHKRKILVVVVALILPPFVLWGGYKAKSSNKDAEKNATGALAKVGGAAVSTDMFRRALSAEADRRGQYGERPSDEMMLTDGTANRVLDRLVEQAILTNVNAERNFKCEREYLIECLKDTPSFKTEDGQFDPAIWNAFVSNDPNRNWTELYETMDDQVGRDVLFAVLMASGRVLEPEIKDAFDEMYSTLTVKQVQIEPAIEPTDEQIQTQYDENPTQYETPRTFTAQYAAISLLAPPSELVNDIVKRARDGENFEAMAKEHSKAFNARSGGNLGWVAERPELDDHVRTVLGMEVGKVSDPITGSAGYFIFKVEEERTNEESGQREVKARQIEIRPELSTDERELRVAKANDLLKQANEGGDLAAAIADAELEVRTAADFSVASPKVEGIAQADMHTFKAAFMDAEIDAVVDVIEGRENLYVAKVTAITEPISQPLADVRDKVVEDARRAFRMSDDYKEQIDTLCEEINEKAKSLNDIVTLYPDLKAEVKDCTPFTVKEARIVPGAMVQSGEVYALFKEKEAGTMAGPVQGFGPQQYFFELVSIEPPAALEGAAANERRDEQKQVRDTMLRMAQYGRMGDYIKFQKGRTPIEYNNTLFTSQFATATEKPEAEADLPADESPADEK